MHNIHIHNIHTYTHIHTYIHTYIYVHTYIHTYIQTCMHTCMYVCMHVCMYACIHTYIHTCTCIDFRHKLDSRITYMYECIVPHHRSCCRPACNPGIRNKSRELSYMCSASSHYCSCRLPEVCHTLPLRVGIPEYFNSRLHA